MLALERLQVRAGQGVAVVVTLHDLTLAARYCDRLAILDAGHLVAIGPPNEALTPQVLRQAFELEGQIIDTPAGPMVAARRAPG